MNELKIYIQELKDEGIIDKDTAAHLLYLIKKLKQS